MPPVEELDVELDEAEEELDDELEVLEADEVASELELRLPELEDELLELDALEVPGIGASGSVRVTRSPSTVYTVPDDKVTRAELPEVSMVPRSND